MKTETSSTTSAGLRYLSFSALLFAVLQWLCPAFIALGAVRIALGAGSLALAAGTVTAIQHFHQTWIRVPMLLLALAGATVNLFVIWQLRRLRNRPSAQWRVSPISQKQLRSERLQIVLSVLTFAFVISEWVTHIVLHHHI